MKNIKLFENIKVIGFDADDTLWENENFFTILKTIYFLINRIRQNRRNQQRTFSTEMSNLSIYGYGVKVLHFQ